MSPGKGENYCEICQLDCKTEVRLTKHISSMAHVLAEQAKSKQEKENEVKKDEEKKEEDEEEEDSDDDSVVETFCNVCNIECKTESGYFNHTTGMGHIMRAQQIGTVEKCEANTLDMTAIKDRAEKGPKLSEPDKPFCDGQESECKLCGFRFNKLDSYENHIQSNAHKRREYIANYDGGIRAFTDGLRIQELGEPPQCMGVLMDYGQTLIGLDYVVEIRRTNPQNPPYYACLSCNDIIAELIPHVTNREHRKRFLQKHLNEHREELGHLFPSSDHEHYDWFSRNLLMNFEKVDKMIKHPGRKWETDLYNVLCDAFYKLYGMQQMKVVQESVGQKPRRWPRTPGGILLRPKTPPPKDPNSTLKSVERWQAKRIYVGNIPDNLEKDSIIDFFNKQLTDLDLGAGQSVADAQINLAKKFAFLHFRTAETASNAMELDGICYQGQYLRLRRPKDYKETPEEKAKRLENEKALVGTAIQGRGAGAGMRGGGMRGGGGNMRGGPMRGLGPMRGGGDMHGGPMRGGGDMHGGPMRGGGPMHGGGGPMRGGPPHLTMGNPRGGKRSYEDNFGGLVSQKMSRYDGNDQGNYDQENYDHGNYDQGGYNQGSYDQGSYNQGGYGQGGYDQGSYDQGNYDQRNYQDYDNSSQYDYTSDYPTPDLLQDFSKNDQQDSSMQGGHRGGRGGSDNRGGMGQGRGGQQEYGAQRSQDGPPQQYGGQRTSGGNQANPQSYDDYNQQSGNQAGGSQNNFGGPQGHYDGSGDDYNAYNQPQAAWPADNGRTAQPPVPARTAAQPRTPAEPPIPEPAQPPLPPPKNLMLTSLSKGYELLQKNSISSDGEQRMATQVLNLLKKNLEKYKSGEKTTGNLPKVKVPEKTGVLDWLRFLVKLLDKGFLSNDAEVAVAQQTLDVLTLRMNTYQSAGQPSAQAAGSVAASSAPGGQAGMISSYNTMASYTSAYAGGYGNASYGPASYGSAYTAGPYGPYGATPAPTAAQTYTMGGTGAYATYTYSTTF